MIKDKITPELKERFKVTIKKTIDTSMPRINQIRRENYDKYFN